MKSLAIPLLVLAIFNSFSLRSQDQLITFTQMEGLNGVPLGKINAITKDKYGFIWFSDQTNRSIIRYDGTSMERYMWDPDDPNSLGGFYPEALDTDEDGNIWIGYYGQGLDRFNPDTREFTHYKNDSNDPESLIHNTVSWVLVDDAGLVWVGTNGGLDRMNPKTGKFDHYIHDPSDERSLSGNTVRKIYQDRKGTIWVGTGFGFNDFVFDGGLNKYHPETNDFTRYLDFEPGLGPNENKVRAIFEDSYGSFWIGTQSNHLYKMNRELGTFESYDVIPDNQSPLMPLPVHAYEHITFITEDSDHYLWIGTAANGIARFHPERGESSHFGNDKYYPDNSSWAILPDESGLLWMSNQDNKLYQIDIYSNIIPSESKRFQCLFQESEDIMWYGTTSQGLVREETKSRKQTRYQNQPGIPTSLSNNSVQDIVKDHKGFIWAGTLNGLNRLDAESGEFTRFKNIPGDSSSLSSNDVNQIFEDSKNRLWVLTRGGGFNLFQQETGDFLRFQPSTTEINTPKGDTPISITEAANGDLWIGYWGNNGLDRFNPESGKFENFLVGLICGSLLTDHQGTVWVGTSNGLYYKNEDEKQFYPVDNSAASGPMVEDDFQNIWIGSSQGIQKLNPERSYLSVFSEKNEITIGADQLGGWFDIVKLQNGIIKLSQILTPTEGRFYTIDPEKIKVHTDTSRLFVTDFLLNGRSEIHKVYGSINLTNKIVLDFDQNVFGMKFTEIDYRNNSGNNIYYMLDGYDLDWRKTTSGDLVNYFKVPPGKYPLNIIATNSSSGIESRKTVSITVLPPWWQTWWAYTLYFIVFVFGVLVVDRFQRRRLIRKERERTKNRELAQAKKIEEAYNQLQSTQSQLVHSEKMASLGELTAGIAHEIQNPLNFVNNFSEVNSELVEELIGELSKGNIKEAEQIGKEIIENEEKITHHGKRAEQIVKSMLQHSRGSEGKKELTDINALCDEYMRLAYHGFRAKDPSFNANFKLDLDPNLPKIEVIPQDIGRVLLNIINNAFQAVAEIDNPIVTLQTQKLTKSLTISIADNGPGIPSDIREKIFQPFFTTKPTGQGTGLGLSLSYDIVTKGHGGTIEVESKEGNGTTFTIKLSK